MAQRQRRRHVQTTHTHKTPNTKSTQNQHTQNQQPTTNNQQPSTITKTTKTTPTTPLKTTPINIKGAHRCMGACLYADGADCWECFDPDDAKGGEKCALAGCSYALDLGNAR